jgi:glycosyltransferase involved in cell wall biosynthesis
MDMTAPLVTVLIPAFNAEATIRRAVDSALAQTYGDFEILVVDDGSRDMTSELVAAYGSEKIRLLRLACNGGESTAMNEGIAVARGQLIAFLDADDEWLPDKLAKQVAVLSRNPDAVMVSCGCRFVNAQGNVIREFGMPPPNLDKNEVWQNLLAGSFIAKPCVVARATALRSVGPFDPSLAIAADQDMWIRLAIRGPVEFVAEFLTTVHDTASSLTKVYADKIDRYVLPMIKRHVHQQRDRLPNRAVRNILGERYAAVGRNLYRTGSLVRGTSLITRAAGMGHDVRENLWYLITASPPAQVLKRLFSYDYIKSVASTKKIPEAESVSHTKHAMLPANAEAIVSFPRDFKPRLLVIVDTEEEFDWREPFSRENTQVGSIRAQGLAEKIFQKFGILPTYAVDYPVASQERSYKLLKELMQAGRCEIGAQLHPWVTPPHEEDVCEANSYANNLPTHLERRKIQELTEIIQRNFGCQPVVYRAGRYGAGRATLRILENLGYQIDCSVLPGPSPQPGAPDYSGGITEPYWLNARRSILEIPVTVGTVGLAGKYGEPLYRQIASPLGLRLRAPAIAARLGIVERIRLTPEGSTIEGCKNLARAMRRNGQRVFVVSFHSPSLEPGHTPYVRDHQDLTTFLRWLEDFFEFFMTEISGVPSTPSEVYERALELAAAN